MQAEALQAEADSLTEPSATEAQEFQDKAFE